MEIKLKKLQLLNFRGERQRVTEFSDVTTISGDNGVGKSRQFDAFLWLLFGKDSQKRCDYNIKTCDADGNPLPKAVVEVSAELLVDNVPVSLRRRYVEKWKSENGEDRFKGNATETFYNSVPVTVTEYNKRIDNLLGGSMFNLVTDPHAFLSQDWQKQRELLFNLAGNVGDHELADKDADIKAFLAELNGKTIDDYKREIRERKKKLQKEYGEIQPRIDQTRRMMPDAVDAAELHRLLSENEEQTRRLEKLATSAQETVKHTQGARLDKARQITDLKIKIADAVQKANSAEKHKASAAQAERDKAEAHLKMTQAELGRMEAVRSLWESDLVAERQRLSECQERRERKLKEWYNESGKEAAKTGNCPTCGQPLSAAMIKQAAADFYRQQDQTLQRLTSEGKRIKEQIEHLAEDIAKMESDLSDLCADMEKKKQEIAQIEDSMSSCVTYTPKLLSATELPDCVEWLQKAEQLQRELDAMSADMALPDYSQDKAKLVAERDRINKELANGDIRLKALAEIERLERLASDIAQQLADIKQSEAQIRHYTLTKINESERRINAMFTMVTFRLFSQTLEGELKETCVAYVNGVPFGTANRASQINAGIDIINTLCQAWNIHAPIWIDNRESVVSLIPTNNQIINLVVAKRQPFTVINN